MKFPTNYDHSPQRLETFSLPSETVPGMDLTVQDIVNKWVYNVDPQIMREPVYYGEDFVDPTSDPDFDLADVPADAEFTANYNKSVSDYRNAKKSSVKEVNKSPQNDDDLTTTNSGDKSE